jgi:magnesium transporter
LRDTYQSRIDARQNDNMQFLTIISVIFLPLTVITGWYGMNFENMPELSHGYPYVIILSIVVILIGIWIFKHKKIL